MKEKSFVNILIYYGIAIKKVQNIHGFLIANDEFVAINYYTLDLVLLVMTSFKGCEMING